MAESEKQLTELQKKTVDLKMLYQGLQEFTNMKELTSIVVNKLIERTKIRIIGLCMAEKKDYNQAVINGHIAAVWEGKCYKVALAEKFLVFHEENPFGFSEEQLRKAETDITNPRNGIVSDEYVDFVLWTKGLKSRQEYFAGFVEKILPPVRYQKLLEVGCGRTACLSKLLAVKGYSMTAMDPQLMPESAAGHNISFRQDTFAFGKTDISEFDALVAQEPCEATEHIIRECTAKKKDFVIGLCGAPHRLMNGEMLEDVYAWYHYLEKTGGSNCVLITPDIIPGYVSHVITGIFSSKANSLGKISKNKCFG